MVNTPTKETEFTTRSIARWGSLAAALLFGIVFVADMFTVTTGKLRWELISNNAVQIALILAVFVGYALAWTVRYEVLGSAIAVLAIVVVFVYHLLIQEIPLSYAFAWVGVPALFHLIAVLLHKRQASQEPAANDATCAG